MIHPIIYLPLKIFEAKQAKLFYFYIEFFVAINLFKLSSMM